MPGRGTIIPAAQRALLCAAQPSCGAAGPADARLGAVGYWFYNRIARCKAVIIDSLTGRMTDRCQTTDDGPDDGPRAWSCYGPMWNEETDRTFKIFRRKGSAIN